MTDRAAIDERVRVSFARQGLMSTLGAELLEASEGVCRVGVDFGAGLTQQHGLWHGAVSAALADVAAGFAAYTLMPEDRQPLSVEFKVNWIAPARGTRMEARARVVANGHRIKHVQVEVVTLQPDRSADADTREGHAGNGGPSRDATVVTLALVTIAATRSVTEVDPTQAPHDGAR